MKRQALLVEFSDDHWLHHQMNVKKSNFNSYIYTLLLDHSVHKLLWLVETDANYAA